MANAIQKISARAKQIQRSHPGWSWKSCIKQASADYRAGKLGKVGTASKSKTRQTGPASKSRKADAKRKAKAPGKRRSASGNTYTERRKNRSDRPKKISSVSETFVRVSYIRYLKKYGKRVPIANSFETIVNGMTIKNPAKDFTPFIDGGIKMYRSRVENFSFSKGMDKGRQIYFDIPNSQYEEGKRRSRMIAKSLLGY